MDILLQFLGIKESGPVFSLELCKGLIQNGCEVYAVLHEDIENREKWVELLGLERVFFVSHFLRRTRPVGSGIDFCKELISLKKKYGKISFDYGIRTFPSKYDDYLGSVLNIDLVVNFLHDPIPHSGVNIKDAKNNMKIVDRGNKIVVLSKSFVPYVVKEYKRDERDVLWVRHGLLSYTDEEKTEPQWFKDNPINFLFFGRIDPYKGIDYLIDAYRQLLEVYPPEVVSLTIAGSGQLDEKSQNLIQSTPNCFLINRYIREDEVDDLFSAANTVLVLPYVDATQSGVMTLAYQYAIPVIATNTGGLKEQLFDGDVGVLVEAKSVDDLKKGMELFVKNGDLYRNEAMKMKMKKTELSWDHIAKRLIDELERT